MRKTIVAISIFLGTFFCGHAQFYDSSLLTYTGGYGKLEKLFSYETSISDVLQNVSFYKNPYLFYQVIFKVHKDGTVGDILINSLYDTALVPSILTAMQKTNGHWVNNSESELVAVLPICYNNVLNDTLGDLSMKQEYDRIDNTQSVKIFSSFYQNWNPQRMVFLKTMKIVGFSPVR